jgi:hypothetical protein
MYDPMAHETEASKAYEEVHNKRTAKMTIADAFT